MTPHRLIQVTSLKLIIVAVCCIPAARMNAQQYSLTGRLDSAFVPQPSMHYLHEFTFDKPADPASWDKESSGLHASFASTDKAYFRTEAPGVQLNEWKGTGWRGERLNAMILAWSPDTINQVRIVLKDLKNEKGQVLSASQFNVQLVRYVISNYPYDAPEVTCGVGPVDKAYLMPDRLESFERFDLPGRTVRPIWLSVNIPVGTTPGIYKGVIEVRSEKESRQMNISLKVQNQQLPAPRDWKFRLDLWQNPWVLATYYKVKPWSNEHMALLKKHMQLYADAGGKYITTYAVHSPWADNSYMIEGSMIEWIKQRNGKWKFDYSIFDKYVQLAIASGIDKAITLYTPIPWGERFRYVDETTGKFITERWLPTSPEFRANWNVFLTDFKTHLEKKGWFGKTYLGINENAMEQTLAAIKVMKDHSPQWRITYAGDWHPELDNLLDDYSCVYGKEPTMGDVAKRLSKKQTTTYYVCCTPAKPNTFVFSPPVEGRWLGWYTQGYGYDGFLRWAYDAWPADPVRDARHVLWPAGDCFMVYPGAESSIRYEKMREGIVDFEKLRIILDKAAKSTDPELKNVAGKLKQHLKTLATQKQLDSKQLESDISKGNELIELLSDRLKN